VSGRQDGQGGRVVGGGWWVVERSYHRRPTTHYLLALLGRLLRRNRSDDEAAAASRRQRRPGLGDRGLDERLYGGSGQDLNRVYANEAESGFQSPAGFLGIRETGAIDKTEADPVSTTGKREDCIDGLSVGP
jgi:hypothetical protein